LRLLINHVKQQAAATLLHLIVSLGVNVMLVRQSASHPVTGVPELIRSTDTWISPNHIEEVEAVWDGKIWRPTTRPGGIHPRFVELMNYGH